MMNLFVVEVFSNWITFKIMIYCTVIQKLAMYRNSFVTLGNSTGIHLVSDVVTAFGV